MDSTGLMEQLEQLEKRWGLSEDECAEARQRLQREAERMRLAERDEVLRAWLSVVDNMERALDADWNGDDPLHAGVQAIHRQMLQILEGFGVRRVPEAGAHPADIPFDPTVHEAVAVVDGSQKDGSVAQIVAPGYLVQDRVLRTAKVTTVRNTGAGSGR